MRKHSGSMTRATLSEINITPLLDLAFVLLIIFMITTPLLEQKIVIDLPESRPTAAEEEVDPKSIKQIAIDEVGRVYLDEERVEVADLESRLIAFKRADKNAAVSLRADANLRYQQIVHVLDAIRESGVKLGLATVPEVKK
ncbi:MAG: biopolymer transporter ExbD [bacterium]